MTTSEKKRFSPAEKIGIWHCTAALFFQLPKKCTILDLSLLYILILGTYSKIAWENHFLAPGVCFPQPCSSAGRVKITFKFVFVFFENLRVFIKE